MACSSRRADDAAATQGPLQRVFNRGGPGWIRDVFECAVKLDNETRFGDAEPLFVVPWSAFEPKVPLYAPDESICGTVVVTAPRGHTVWHQGISIAFTQYLCTTDPFDQTTQLTMERVLVDSPGPVTETLSVPFRLDLREAEQSPMFPLLDMYSGKLFGLQHQLVVSIHRPWFTFPVTAYKMVGIQRIQQQPPPPPPAAGGATAALQLSVNLEGRGSVVARLSSSAVEAGGTLEVRAEAVGVRPDMLTAARLVMFSVETAEGSVSQQGLVAEVDLLSPLRRALTGTTVSASASVPLRGVAPSFETSGGDDAAEADCKLKYYVQLLARCGEEAVDCASLAEEVVVWRGQFDALCNEPA